MISDSQKLDTNVITTLVEIDFSGCIAFAPTGSTVLRFCSSANGAAAVVFAGQTYEYVGFDATGFRSEINGQPPAPVINFDKTALQNYAAYTALWDQYTAQTNEFYFDPRGAKVKLFRVANLNQVANVQEYVVSQATKITKNVVEWQLSVGLGADRLGSDSITRLSINRCALRYRRWNATTSAFEHTSEAAGGCPYGNPTTVSNWSAVPGFGTKYYTATDQELDPVNRQLDRCSYSARGCQLRFDPTEIGLTLPFVMLYSPNILGKQ